MDIIFFHFICQSTFVSCARKINRVAKWRSALAKERVKVKLGCVFNFYTIWCGFNRVLKFCIEVVFTNT